MPAPSAMEDLDELGQLIRRAREAHRPKKLSQGDLAALLEIKQSHMSGIETGIADVSAGLLGKIHEKLGIGLETLTRAAIARARARGHVHPPAAHNDIGASDTTPEGEDISPDPGTVGLRPDACIGPIDTSGLDSGLEEDEVSTEVALCAAGSQP